MQQLQTTQSSKGLIEICEEEQQIFWASSLGVSVQQLKSAVRATQSLDARQLRTYLKTKHHQQNIKSHGNQSNYPEGR